MSSGQDRKALGRGLSALLPGSRSAGAGTAANAPPNASQRPEPLGHSLQVPLDRIEANPLQPRTVFQVERLSELAQSIRENGIIQPLVVRKAGDRYQLVAGERRWRAARLAGLSEVPVVVQDFAEGRLLEITLIENIQREDLNPIEVAQAFQRLSQELGLSHEQIAQRTGKDRTTITNMIRLLKLPGEVQILLAEQRLSMGHARAILGLDSPDMQVEVAQKAAALGSSVRQVEKLVQKLTASTQTEAQPEAPRQDPNVKAAISEMERVLGTRVRIVEKTEQRGRIEIEYYSMDELIRIYEQIAGEEK